MTKSERETLIQVCRMRAKVGNADAASRSATLKADCEAQLARIYHWDQDDVWRQAMTAADEAVELAHRQIAERSRELGIRAAFQPEISLRWWGRGESASRERRAELRKVAYTKIDELEKQAKLAIDRQSVETQTRLLAEGLTSGDAQNWLDSMPTAEQLMPPVSMAEIRKQLRRGTDD
jgi:hypothetical protein